MKTERQQLHQYKKIREYCYDVLLSMKKIIEIEDRKPNSMEKQIAGDLITKFYYSDNLINILEAAIAHKKSINKEKKEVDRLKKKKDEWAKHNFPTFQEFLRAVIDASKGKIDPRLRWIRRVV